MKQEKRKEKESNEGKKGKEQIKDRQERKNL